MAIALIVLAIGSVIAGYVNVPHVLGGNAALGAFLDPSFEPPSRQLVQGAEVAGGGANEVAEAAEAGEAEGAEAGLELTLMIVSSLIAIAGIALAFYIWLKRREIADAMAVRFRGLYTTLLNKYYVDEFYDAIVVWPILVVSREGLWRGFDVKVIDAAVNGAGTIVAGGAWMLRRLQTGSVRAYASSLFIGVIVILGYYLWR